MICRGNNYLNFLFSLQRRGIKLGLQHTEKLLQFFNNPHKKITTIHVAGTNGKGSTCAYIESVLRQNSFKVGIYTSPHLFNFNERIRVNGRPISDDEIVYFLNNALSAINRIKSTFFEATTVMAFDYFWKKRVDVAVIETGLGGRLDATNVISPKISVITSISRDHTDILGESIEDICFEKAGIIKEKTPLIIYEQDNMILDIFQKKADAQNADMKISKTPKNINIHLKGTKFTFNDRRYSIPLFGYHQARNAALAIDAVSAFDSSIQHETIHEGLKKVFWPGRLQKIGENVFYDVSHNENGLKNTLQTLKRLYPFQDIHGLLCLKKDKNLETFKDLILKNFKTLIVSEDKNGLLCNSNILAEKLEKLQINSKTVNSLEKGSSIIKSLVKNNSSIGLIFGSHYIAEEVFRAFEIPFDNYYI